MIARTMNAVLDRWNGLDEEAAAEEVLPCCGSREWAHRLARRRPLLDEAELIEASDAVWWNLEPSDWAEAFACHPRIGERHAAGAATERSLAWSAREQKDAAANQAQVAELLAEGNRAYEARFGRTFLIFAIGRSAVEILGVLEQRMGNDPETELRAAAEQQRQITRLRLERWMEAA